MDRETSQLVFGAVKRREREAKEGGREGSVKRQKMDALREGCPVVMLTGISQSIAKKLKTVSDCCTIQCRESLSCSSDVDVPLHLLQTILQLGGVVTDRPADCTHLVAPRVGLSSHIDMYTVYMWLCV